MDRDSVLLTPGPLTTTLRTKLAMLRDWGSWDAEFNALTAQIRRELLAIAHAEEAHVAVPLQGSGTFSIEAAVATIVPPSCGHRHAWPEPVRAAARWEWFLRCSPLETPSGVVGCCRAGDQRPPMQPGPHQACHSVRSVQAG